jgi:hypothetical protein
VKKQPTKEEQEEAKERAKLAIILDRIDEAKKHCKTWWADSKASIEEASRGEKTSKKTGRTEKKGYPAWWSAVRTVQPAIYSRTPSVVSRAMLTDIEDTAADLASICLERLGHQLIEACPFDAVMGYTRDIYIHSGRTAPRVVFEAKFKQETVQQKIYVQPTNEQPLDGNVQYQQDEQGIFYIQEQIIEKLETASVQPKPLHYEDAVHYPPCARWHQEIEAMAYKVEMSKKEFSERFGEEYLEIVSFDYDSGDEGKTSSKGKSKGGNQCCVWEYWNKKDKKVYWLTECYKEGFLDVKDDPYELVGFFPSPPYMIGTTDLEDLYPVPDFIHLEPFIKQLNASFDRYRRLLLTLKRKGIYDQSFKELEKLGQNTDDGDFIGLKNFRQLIQDGGLDTVIKFFPVREFSQAVVEVANAIQDFEQKFYELYGIPDILRGVSDPRETAAAQQQKGRFTSLRFSAIQRDFQRLAKDTIEIMCDLALKFFPDDKLADLCGYRFFDEQQKALWPEVLQILRNDQQRQLRIEIETDSTITMNEQAEIEKRKYLADVITAGVQGFGNPNMTQSGQVVLAEALQYFIRGMSSGKQLNASLGALIKELKTPPPPPEPPPPDPAIENAKMDYQLKIQKMNQESMDRQTDAALRSKELDMKMAGLQVESTLKQRELFLEEQRLKFDADMAGVKTVIDVQAQKNEQKMKMLEHSLEAMKVKMSEEEKLLTELRLQREEARKEQGEIKNKLESANSQPQAINLTVEGSKPTRKKAKISKDPQGNTVIETEELGE